MLPGRGRCACLLALVQPCLWQERELCRGSRLRKMPQLQFKDAFWVSEDGCQLEPVVWALGRPVRLKFPRGWWVGMRLQEGDFS